MFGKKPEVLVVGAGPVGLFAALSLVRRGVRVQIVDRDWRTGAHSYALALHARSLELLAELGLADEALRRAYRIRRVGVYEALQRKSTLRLADAGDDRAVAVLRQDSLEGLLEEALGRLGVEVLWNHEVSDLTPGPDNVVVRIDRLRKESVGYAAPRTEWVVDKTGSCEVPFVLAADGHHSKVRHALGIDFLPAGPPLHFAVFEFKTGTDLDHEMRVVLSKETTDAVWPMPDGYCRWSFELPAFHRPTLRVKDRLAAQVGQTQFEELEEENLRRLLAYQAPWFGGSVEDLAWRIVVKFEPHVAAAFAKGRVGLAGDAGHVAGPVGMQSMNVGLLEAKELAETFAQGSKVCLDEYDRRRRAEWNSLLGLEGGALPATPRDPWAAANLARLVPCIPASGSELASLLEQFETA